MIWIVANNVELRKNDNNRAQFVEFTYLIPVSYTHLTLPTNREV